MQDEALFHFIKIQPTRIDWINHPRGYHPQIWALWTQVASGASARQETSLSFVRILQTLTGWHLMLQRRCKLQDSKNITWDPPPTYVPWLVVWLLLGSSSMQSHRIKVAVLERKTRDILDVCYLFGFSSQPNNQPRYIGWRTVSCIVPIWTLKNSLAKSTERGVKRSSEFCMVCDLNFALNISYWSSL